MSADLPPFRPAAPAIQVPRSMVVGGLHPGRGHTLGSQKASQLLYTCQISFNIKPTACVNPPAAADIRLMAVAVKGLKVKKKTEEML